LDRSGEFQCVSSMCGPAARTNDDAPLDGATGSGGGAKDHAK